MFHWNENEHHCQKPTSTVLWVSIRGFFRSVLVSLGLAWIWFGFSLGQGSVSLGTDVFICLSINSPVFDSVFLILKHFEKLKLAPNQFFLGQVH